MRKYLVICSFIIVACGHVPVELDTYVRSQDEHYGCIYGFRNPGAEED